MSVYKITIEDTTNLTSLVFEIETISFEEAIRNILFYNFDEETYDKVANANVYGSTLKENVDKINKLIMPCKITHLVMNGRPINLESKNSE